MITKAEAAAAIRATTAPGKERARLLGFVDQQTDDQLHQWLIQAEDGHETIVEFIKEKADSKFHASWFTVGFALFGMPAEPWSLERALLPPNCRRGSCCWRDAR